MKSLLFLSAVVLLGCGNSSSRNQGHIGNEAGAAGLEDLGGAGGVTIDGPIGGSDTGKAGSTGTGGSTGDTGGSGGSPATGGSPEETGGQAGSVGNTGGQAGSADNTGGTGNIGGNCQPWNADNIAIYLSGWTPESGTPIPKACGMVADPCTGQWSDMGECGYFQRCGGRNAISPNGYSANLGDSIDNICGNLCVADHSGQAFLECVIDRYAYAFVCADGFDVTPEVPDGCENGVQTSFTTWCCG